MRSAKEILEALGFNSAAPDSTKNAFLKNLSRATNEFEKADVIDAAFGLKNSQEMATEKQLSFDSELLGIQPSPRTKTGS